MVRHVASTTRRQLDDGPLVTAGIDPGAVRFSIALEAADGHIADVAEALDMLKGRG